MAGTIMNCCLRCGRARLAAFLPFFEGCFLVASVKSGESNGWCSSEAEDERNHLHLGAGIPSDAERIVFITAPAKPVVHSFQILWDLVLN